MLKTTLPSQHATYQINPSKPTGVVETVGRTSAHDGFGKIFKLKKEGGTVEIAVLIEHIEVKSQDSYGREMDPKMEKRSNNLLTTTNLKRFFRTHETVGRQFANRGQNSVKILDFGIAFYQSLARQFELHAKCLRPPDLRRQTARLLLKTRILSTKIYHNHSRAWNNRIQHYKSIAIVLQVNETPVCDTESCLSLLTKKTSYLSKFIRHDIAMERQW